MYIPRKKKQNCHVSEGCSSSNLVFMYSVQGKGKCDSAVKILFATLGPGTKLEQPVVASEYCVDASCEQLVDDLNTILTSEAEAHFDEKSVNDQLIDVVVKGYRNADHERPCAFVTAAYPSRVEFGLNF
jgi:hypothetical protein